MSLSLSTYTLIAIFVLAYWLLVSPKLLGAGVAFGAFLGLALGVASGLGTYIHMKPAPKEARTAPCLTHMCAIIGVRRYLEEDER